MERLAIVEDRGDAYGGPHLRPLHAFESARGLAPGLVRACDLQAAMSRRSQPLLVSIDMIA